jgi:hypothetical protein
VAKSKISLRPNIKPTKRKKFVTGRRGSPKHTSSNNFGLLKTRNLLRSSKILNYSIKRLRLPIKRIRNFTLKINNYKLIKSKTYLRLLLNKIKAQYSVNASLSYVESPSVRSNWEYSNPYLFMNVRGIHNLPPFTLIDSFIHNKLQPFTTFQARNSKAQLLFHKKLRRHSSQRGFIDQHKIKKLGLHSNQTTKQPFRPFNSILVAKLTPLKLRSIDYSKPYQRYFTKKSPFCT